MNVVKWDRFILGFVLVFIGLIWVLLYRVTFLSMILTFGFIFAVVIFALGAVLFIIIGSDFIRKGMKE